MTRGSARLRRISTMLAGALFGTVFLAGALAPAAHAASASPATGPTAGGNVVAVSGSNFSQILDVTVGGVAAHYSLVNSSTVNVTMPAHAAGAATIAIDYEYMSCIEYMFGTCMGYMPVYSTATANYTYESGPAVSSISPSSGTTAGGTAVVINGANFVSGSTLSVGGTSIPYTLVSSSQINATMPAHAAGAVSIQVTDAYGTSTLSNGYTYDAPPAITGISPSTGSTAGGTVVTITGSNLTSSTTATIGGVTAHVNSVTSTSMSVTTPALPAGAATVQVSNAYGQSSLSNAFTAGAAPTISSTSPAAGSTNGGTSVTLTGTNFTGATKVTVNNVSVSYTVASATSITFKTPSSAAGAVAIAVTTPYGTATSSNAFTYGPSPTISQVSPNSGLANTTTANVVISGANFTGVTSVTFGGTAATITASSSTSITVTAPSKAAGAVDVAVTTPDGTATAAGAFTYGADPTISTISPNDGALNTAISGVVIKGANFSGTPTVRFGSVPATSVVLNSSSQLTVTAPSSSTAGSVDVSITIGSYTVTMTNGFTYGATPSISSLNTRTGSTGGGTTVVITGANFYSSSNQPSVTSVTFGGVNATSFTVNSSTQITAVTPAHAAGAVGVSVSDAFGTGTLNNGFTYGAPPTITSAVASSGSTSGGATVVITGTNLTDASVVQLAGVNASSFVVNNSTQITAVSASTSARSGTVTVTTPYGSYSLASGYAYGTPPNVTSISPAYATAGSTKTGIVITGTDLTGASVTFGSTAAAAVVVNSSTQLTVTAPALSAGTVNVVVTTPYGTETVSNAFTYGSAPTVTSVSANTGSTSGGTSVTITGTNFTGATGVTFDGTAALSYTVSSATSITATTPSHAAGAVSVAVATKYGTGTGASAYTYVAPPTITSLSTSKGSTAGGTSVTITGTNFSNVSGAAGVKFGGVNATSYTVNSATSITAVTPAGSAGAVSVSVTDAGGTATLNSGFTYGAPPTVTSVSSSTGSTSGSTSVTITGTNFTGATAVTFGGVAAVSFTVASATSITAVTPAHAAGAVAVAVTNPYATGTTSSAFTYGAPPTLTSVSPNHGTTSSTTANVVLTGTNLTGTSAVTFGGTAATSIVVNSATQVTLTAPAHAAGAVDIVLTTPYGSTTYASAFTYTAAPTITSLSPTSGSTNGSTTVTINGANFGGVTTVAFGGNLATVVSNSGTVLTVTTPSHAAGAVDVAITNPGGTTTSSNAFTYDAPPTVTGNSPSTTSTAGGATITLTGTNFTGATGVTVGGTAATGLSVASATSLSFTAPAHAAGAVDIVVTTPYGSGTRSGGLTYGAPPTLTSLTPSAGTTAGGESVVIAGTNFTGATAVTFGGTAATSFTVNNANQITAVAPAKSAGAASVAITTPYGTVTASNAFAYGPPPALTSLSPTSGATAGSTSVVLTGQNFTGATHVTFNGVNATSFVVNTATQITAIAPAGSAGAVSVAVTTADGTSTLASSYTYVGPPTVSSVSPSTGSTNGGTTVTLTGTNFTDVTSVTVGGTSASHSVTSATSMTVTMPAHPVGSASIVVTTGYGSVTSSGTFTYDAPPAISHLSIASGSTAGGTTVIITGTDFTGASSVTFGGTNATSFTVNASNQITAVAPAHAAGAVSLVVTTAYGTGSTTYTYGASPTITSLATTTGTTSGGTSVVITGTNFTGATTVAFGGNIATFTVNTANQITATTPSNTAGAKDVVITTGYGTVTSSNAFTYGAPPTLTSASVSTGPTTGGTSVALTGTNLGGATRVTFGGINAESLALNSATQVTAVTPPDSAGAVTIAVTTPYGTASLSNGFTFGLAPVYTSISPSTGPASQTTAGVVITGANLAGATSVTFGGTAATITANTSTALTVTAPAKSAGAETVVITTPYGTDTISNAFTYGSAPTVSSLSTTTGTTAGGTSVTITGTNFTGATAVTFDGEHTTFTVVSSTSITATTPSHGPGAVNVVVTTPYGSGTKSSGFTYGNPPTVSSLSPSTGPTTGATSVTITGTNFTGATAVSFGSTAATSFAVISSTQITAVAPAGSAGAVNVVVTTPYGTGTKSSGYTYGSVPIVTSLSAVTGSTAGGTSVKITGTHLTGASRVTFGNAAATGLTFVSDSEITVVTPANVPGSYTVTVTTGYGPGSLANAFTYGNPPTVSTVSPGHGTASATTANVVITGTNFSGASVKFGSDPATITAATSTSLTVTAPAQAAGVVPVYVTTPYGTVQYANGFTYGTGPSVTSLNTTSGSTNGGTSVAISGANLTGATSVKFGGTAATSFTVNSATSITATTPAHASGAVSVEVTTQYGTSTLSNAYTYYSPPVVTSVSPNKGSTLGFQTISVKGSNFNKISTVKFGGVPLAVLAVSSTEIQVQTVPASAGTVSVEVIGTYGSSTLGSAFTYEAPPAISSVSPAYGDVGTTTPNVVITGSYFTDASSVTFGGTAATFVVNSSTKITATAPNRSAGAVTVAVTTPGGTAQRSNGFTYGYAPTITSISPKTGVSGTTNPGVVISGANLTGASVTFGGTAATVTSSSASSLTVTAPSRPDGAVSVVVTTSYGSATMSNGYTYGDKPAVDEVVPSTGSTLGGTRLTISGANFTSSPLPTVTIGGTAATGITFVSASEIYATAPAGTAGAKDVVVTTSFGTNTLTGGYTYDAPPTVSHASPTTGLTTGGTTVTISGTGYTNVTGVTFGGTPATSFTVDNSGEITAVAPAHAAGGVSIGVTTAYGTGTLTNAFTYGSPPTVTSMTPRVGDANVTTSDIVITGTNLSGATVRFGSLTATIESDESTSITVTAPAQAAGSVDLTVSTVFGSTTIEDAFSYGNLPGISMVSPSTGSSDGGRLVYITGSFLSGATHVKFGSQDATSFTVVDSTHITAITPAASPGTESVTVITPYGTVTETGAYTFGRSPSITDVTPDSGTTSGGETVTITGSNLSGTTAVFIGGAQATSVTVVSPTEVTAVAPARDAGARSIALRTPYGIASSPLAFTFVAPAGSTGGSSSSSSDTREVVDALLFGGVCPLGWTEGYASWANGGNGGKTCSAPAGTKIPEAVNLAGATDSPFINDAINKAVLSLIKKVKSNVTFAPNSSELTAEAKSVLRQHVKKVNAGSRAVTTVEGVVEVTTKNKAAEKLAKARADSVAGYLRSLGILGLVRVLPGAQEFDTTRAGFARVRTTLKGQKR